MLILLAKKKYIKHLIGYFSALVQDIRAAHEPHMYLVGRVVTSQTFPSFFLFINVSFMHFTFQREIFRSLSKFMLAEKS